MKEITIVIPNYNGMEYLPECLEALNCQEQSKAAFQVVVVDNGSTDGSVEFLKNNMRYEYELNSIFLKENTGFDYAVNQGIQSCDSPYVILLNNDTKVYPEFVKELYEAIRVDENIFSVSAQMLMWDRPDLLDDAGDRYCVLGWAYSRGKGKAAADYNEPAEIFSACAGAAIYRRSIFEEIGYFDELHFAYLEDVDIGYRALIYGYRNLYAPKARVLHYGSASTGSRYNEKKTELAATNSVYLIGKNMPLLQWIWNLPFIFLGFFLKFLFFVKKRMGILYLRGLWLGWKRCMSREGRIRKVPFSRKHMINYIRIQMQLYANTIRILKKS